MTGAPNDQRQKIPTASTEIYRWTTSNKDVFIVELQTYADGRIIAIRRWYRDPAGELRPGRSGISIPVSDSSEIAAAAEAIRKALDTPLSGLAALRSPAAPEHEAEAEPEPDVEHLPPPATPSRMPFLHLARRPPQPPVQQRATPPAPARPAAPAAPAPVAVPASSARQPTVKVPLLASIIKKGLVRAPLRVRVETSTGRHSGLVYADGTIVFGDKSFATPREAVMALFGQTHIVDAWQSMKYLNPATSRYTKLGRLRNTYLGLEESATVDGD